MDKIVNKCINGISEIAIAQIEAGDEKGAMETIKALGSLGKSLMESSEET